MARILVDGTDSPVASPLATNLGFLVATAAAPNGGLYYLSRSGGVLGLIEPVPEPSTLMLVVPSLAYLGFRRQAGQGDSVRTRPGCQANWGRATPPPAYNEVQWPC